MNDKLYDALMRLTKYALPALGTLYLTLSQIWDFPYGEEVLGTVVALETALGIILAVAKGKYTPPKDGEIDILEDEEGNKGVSVRIEDPVALLGKDDVRLDIRHNY